MSDLMHDLSCSTAETVNW